MLFLMLFLGLLGYGMIGAIFGSYYQEDLGYTLLASIVAAIGWPYYGLKILLPKLHAAMQELREGKK